MNKKYLAFVLISICVFLGGFINLVTVATAADQNYGEQDSPITLTIGYDPIFTQSWSAAILRGKKFYNNYLKSDSTVEFVAGSDQALLGGLLSGKIHIAYLSDMQAIAATTRSEADIRIVGVTAFAHDQCNILLTRYSAPNFKDTKEAFQWLKGKQIAAPKNLCNDRFMQAILQKEKIEPAVYYDQNAAAIAYSLRNNKIDAAVLSEPLASKLVQEGSARRVASGKSINENDGGFIVMRNDLIKQRPDVVKAWLKAELDAQLFLSEAKNTKEVASILSRQTTGYAPRLLWYSLYGQRPANQDNVDTKATYYYVFSDEVKAFINKVTTFLNTSKYINAPKLRNDAILSNYTDEILKERNLSSPIGEVRAQEESPYKAK